MSSIRNFSIYSASANGFFSRPKKKLYTPKIFVLAPFIISWFLNKTDKFVDLYLFRGFLPGESLPEVLRKSFSELELQNYSQRKERGFHF